MSSAQAGSTRRRNPLAPLSVQAIAQRYADCFAQMLESTSMGARNRWHFDLKAWLPVSMRLHRR